MEPSCILDQGSYEEKLLLLSSCQAFSNEHLDQLCRFTLICEDQRLLYLVSKILQTLIETEEDCSRLLECLKKSAELQKWLSLTQLIDTLSKLIKQKLHSLTSVQSVLLPLFIQLSQPLQPIPLQSFLRLCCKVIKVNGYKSIPNEIYVQVIQLLCSLEIPSFLQYECLRMVCKSLPSGDKLVNLDQAVPDQCRLVLCDDGILSCLTRLISHSPTPSDNQPFCGGSTKLAKSYEELDSSIVSSSCQSVSSLSLLILCKSCAACTVDAQLHSNIERTVTELSCLDFCAVLCHHDDFLIEAMLCWLILHERLSNKCLMNPHHLMLTFVDKYAAGDNGLLLDLLTSPETPFLLYFTKYLKLVSTEWSLFTSSCDSNATLKPVSLVAYSDDEEDDDNTQDELTDSKLDQLMAVFIRLRLSIERLHEADLFPYNPKSLLNLLVYVESLYEQ